MSKLDAVILFLIIFIPSAIAAPTLIVMYNAPSACGNIYLGVSAAEVAEIAKHCEDR